MTKTPAKGMAEIAKVTGALVEAVVAQEAQALHLMQVALARPVVSLNKADRALQETRTESLFDNMPI